MRRAQRVAAAAAAVVLLGGCGFRGASSLSLPGGADTGDDPYTVEVEFLDVLDLVPQSGVRVADVPVGRVESIELDPDDWTALVTISVNRDVELPANAVAAIQQSSLLGEKYVELAPPGNEEPQGRLDDGARIGLDRTNRNVEVEELLGALSLVLNGGGLAQLQTINRELGDALEGREAEIKDTLDQLDTFIGGLDAQKDGDQPGAGPRRTSWPPPSPPARRRSRTPWTPSARASTSSTSSATCWCRCWRAWPGWATSAPGSSTSRRPTPSRT